MIDDDDYVPVDERVERHLAHLCQMQEQRRQTRIACQVAWISFGITVLLVVLIGWFAST